MKTLSSLLFLNQRVGERIWKWVGVFLFVTSMRAPLVFWETGMLKVFQVLELSHIMNNYPLQNASGAPLGNTNRAGTHFTNEKAILRS